MEHIASIAGAISGITALIGVIYMLAYWRGKVDAQLNSQSKTFQDYPLGEMWTMVKTLWEIYVVEALHHRPDLAQRGSGFKLKKEGEDLISDHMRTLLEDIPRNPFNSEYIATGYMVVKHIGLDIINEMAEQKKLSVQEAIAILSCYLEAHCNNAHPTA